MKNKKLVSSLVLLCSLVLLSSCGRTQTTSQEAMLSPSAAASVASIAPVETQPVLATPTATVAPFPTVAETETPPAPTPAMTPAVAAEVTYQSGIDLPAGVYYLQSSNGESSYEIQDPTGALLSDGNFVTNCYVELMEERTLIVKNAAVIPASEAPERQADANGSYSQGHYLVGRDIPAGKYEITSTGTEQAVCRHMTGANNVASNILRKWEIDTPVVIEAKEGEYIQLRNCSVASTSKEATPLSYAVDMSPPAAAPQTQTVSQPAMAEPTATPAEEKAEEGYRVYITNTGEKYHSSGCQYLRKSKHEIDIKTAQSRGYTACSRCNP